MARERYHHGDLPRTLVEVSLDLVRAHGVEGFSLRAAARTAGVHPAAVYRHFADREELLAAVADAGFRMLADRMRAESAGAAGPAERFAAVGGAYVRFAVAHPAHFRVMFSRARSPVAGGGSARDLLDDGLRDLGVDAPGAALVAWSAVHGLASLVVDGADPADGAELDAAIDDLTAAVLRGLPDRTGAARPGAGAALSPAAGAE
jgi:AcrR family transcriptional regulator